jgi:small-conductance mechanosensitive channel
LAVLAIALVVTAAGQDTSATVRLYGRPLFRVTPNAGMDANARAAQIERRLNRLVETQSTTGAIRIDRPGPAERVIAIGSASIVTITAADAEENLADVDALAQQWASRIEAAIGQAQGEARSPAKLFLVRVQSAFRTAFSRLAESAADIVPAVLAAVLVLALFWGVAALVRRLLRATLPRVTTDNTLASLIKQGAFYTIGLIGVFVAAGAMGFDPENVATGLGLTSLAFGFALKDILSNFVSGMLLLVLRPFELGDQIVVGETEGSVERIELRATQIRTYDGRIVYVPNADIFTSRVINNTATPVRRAAIRLPVGYDQDLRLATETARSAAQAADGVLDTPSPSVRIEELGADDILVAVQFWADSRRSDYAATTSAVRRSVVEALNRAGIALPEPNVRVIIPRNPVIEPQGMRQDPQRHGRQ